MFLIILNKTIILPEGQFSAVTHLFSVRKNPSEHSEQELALLANKHSAQPT